MFKIKENYLSLTGEFIATEDVITLVNPKSHKETLCFTIDQNHRLIPVMSYDTLGRICRRYKNKQPPVNPLIEKHNSIFSLFTYEFSGVKNGIVVDVDLFIYTVFNWNSEAPLSMRENRGINLNEDMMRNLFVNGYQIKYFAYDGRACSSRTFKYNYLAAFVNQYKQHISTAPYDEVQPLTVADIDFLHEIANLLEDPMVVQPTVNMPITTSYNNKRQRTDEPDLNQSVKYARTLSF